MSDALSTIGSAAVTTVGTVAVAGMATKAISKVAGGAGRSSGGKRTGKKSNYRVFSGTKHSGKKSKSMLGF